jgi:hypothetical protein
VRQQIAIAAGSLLVAAATASGQVPPPVTAPGPLAVVTKLYQEYAAQAVIDSPEFSMEDLFGRPRAAMARYLDDPLIALVLADRACSARKQEVCNLDFMPIWDAQDAAGATVKISEGKDPSRVAAEIHFSDGVRHFTFVMVKSAAGWRIHDIEYDKGSLVKILKGKP